MVSPLWKVNYVMETVFKYTYFGLSVMCFLAILVSLFSADIYINFDVSATTFYQMMYRPSPFIGSESYIPACIFWVKGKETPSLNDVLLQL